MITTTWWILWIPAPAGFGFAAGGLARRPVTRHAAAATATVIAAALVLRGGLTGLRPR